MPRLEAGFVLLIWAIPAAVCSALANDAQSDRGGLWMGSWALFPKEEE